MNRGSTAMAGACTCLRGDPRWQPAPDQQRSQRRLLSPGAVSAMLLTTAIICTYSAAAAGTHEDSPQLADAATASRSVAIGDPRLLRPQLAIASSNADSDAAGLVRVAGVGSAGLRLRSGPGGQFPATNILRDAAVVRLTGATQRDEKGTSWSEVIGWRAEILRGWSASRYLEPSRCTDASDEACGSTKPAIQGRVMPVTVTAYSYQEPGAGADGVITRSGEQARWGIVAVDPSLIPLGSSLAIDGYGQLFRAEDTGFGIRGSHIDLFVPSEQEATEFGVQYRDIVVFN